MPSFRSGSVLLTPLAAVFAGDQALTYGVLLHVVGFGPIVVLGGLRLWAVLSASDPRAGEHRLRFPRYGPRVSDAEITI